MKTFIAVLLMSTQLFAIPEANYATEYKEKVLPHFAKAQQKVFTTKNGVHLNYFHLANPNSDKTLIILPGRSEPARKYAELVYDLKDDGYEIYLLDHQGQGESERLVKDSQKGYVRKFDNYVNDFKEWLTLIVLPNTNHRKPFLLAHSMGGAVAARFLAQNNGSIEKVVLGSPMLQINTHPYSEGVAMALTKTLVGVGLGKKYAPERGPYDADADTFVMNEMTHSEPRFDMTKALFVENPKMVLGGPTNRWVVESLKATKSIHKLAPSISTPVMMLQAGQDTIVKLARQNEFCTLHKSCEKLHFPYARHEILMESDDIRDVAVQAIRLFLK